MMHVLLYIFFGALLLSPVGAYAGIVTVGKGQQYELLSQAETKLQDGDIIEIVPGIYQDCAILSASNLTIRPKGWPTVQKRVRFKNVSCQGKAIFVIVGDNTRIEGIEFENARVPELNGAGIRLEGANLFLQDTYFLNNEHGIITGNNHESTVNINRSVFEKNGKCPPNWGHGVYFGKLGNVKVTNSTFIETQTGHHIKSRALYTEIVGNEIIDGKEGTASYAIDISNGGSVVIEDNFIQKGPKSDNNSIAICIACEGESNRGNKIVVRNNKFINNTGNRVIFVNNLTGIVPLIENNKFKGDKTVLVEGSSLECIPENGQIKFTEE